MPASTLPPPIIDHKNKISQCLLAPSPPPALDIAIVPWRVTKRIFSTIGQDMAELLAVKRLCGGWVVSDQLHRDVNVRDESEELSVIFTL